MAELPSCEAAEGNDFEPSFPGPSFSPEGDAFWNKVGPTLRSPGKTLGHPGPTYPCLHGPAGAPFRLVGVQLAEVSAWLREASGIPWAADARRLR
jgi:hypothetical protein